MMIPGFIPKNLSNNLRTSAEYEPAGIIAMWSGPLSTIPAGWKLSDGTAGTINTTSLFVYSTGSMEAPGATGGSTSHAHSYSTVPFHDHGVTSTTSTPHRHSYTISSSTISGGYNGLLPWTAYRRISTSTGDSSASHNHGGYTHYTGETGLLYTSEEEDIIPPYYGMAFIEKAASDNPIPVDLIVMWAGSIDSIPSGWELCNGSNGTPDLRDEFIRGAAPGEDPGTLGGTIAHSHTYTEIPEHRHSIDTGGANHDHGVSGVPVTVSIDIFQYRPAFKVASGYTGYTSYSHTHSVPTVGLTTCTTEDTENNPPYFKVAFIMNTVEVDELPLGAITMWGDSIANIPQGWNQCTGTSGTPNMFNRFPKGVATGEQPGLVGGSATHRHIYTEVPQHTHTIPSDPMTHRHSRHVESGHDNALAGSYTLDRYPSQSSFNTGYPSPTPSHNHDINPTGSETCYTSYENSVPPYVKLIYMQKGQSLLSPTPLNGATDIIYNPQLSVYVNDLEGDNLNVTFYDAFDDSLIDWDYVFGGSGMASVTWAGLSSETSYSWYVKVDDGSTVTQSPTWVFTTNYAPGVPTNPTPNDGATDINYNPTLSVDVFDNDGDSLNVSFYNNASDAIIGWDFVFGGSGKASVSWSGLSSDTNYSWYAKSDDGLSVTKSATWSFTTNYKPGVPTNPTPNDGATGISYSPTLSVDVSDDDGDDLTVSFYDASDDSLIDTEIVLGGSGTASVTWSGLSSDTSYSWYAIADDGLNITQSATWSFTTNYVPNVPTNPTPNDGATDIPDDPIISVDVSDDDGDTLTVSFYDASDDSLIDDEIVLGGSGTASVTWTGLSSETSYSWYAISDDGLSGTQSATWSFTTEIFIIIHPPQVSNPVPSDLAYSVDDNPTLSVDVFDIDGDDLTVTFYNASDDSVIGLDIVTGGSGTASVTWSGVSSEMNCEWYVIANDGIFATQSSTWRFTTFDETNIPPAIPLPGLIPIGIIVIGTTGILSVITHLRRKRLE